MTAPALEIGLEIIEYVIENKKAGFNELKEELHIGSSSLSRYLKVLMAKDYLAKSEDKRYIQGINLIKIHQDESDPLQNIIYPVVKNISQKLGYTTLCMKFINGKIVCYEKHIYPQGLTMQYIGETRTDYILHPWGYFYLAKCNKREREYLINLNETNLFNTDQYQIPSPALQKYFLKMVKNEGYVDDQGKLYNHIRRIAVPVFFQNKLQAAIGIGAISAAIKENEAEKIINVLKDKIASITH